MSVFTDKEQTAIFYMKKKAQEVSSEMLFKLSTLRNAPPIDGTKIIIAGGAFTSWYHGKRVKDIDFFFLKDEPTRHTVRLYLVNAQNDNTNNVRDKSDYIRDKNLSIDSVFDEQLKDMPTPFQYIFTKYETRQDLLNHFDFVHATISYNLGEDKLYITRQAFDAMREKKLIVNRENEPEQWRLDKFKNAGWKMPEKKADSYTQTLGDIFARAMARQTAFSAS